MINTRKLAEFILDNDLAIAMAAQDIMECMEEDMLKLFELEGVTKAVVDDYINAWEVDEDYFLWMIGSIMEHIYNANPEDAKPWLDEYFEPWPGPGTTIDLQEKFEDDLRIRLSDQLLVQVLEAVEID